MSINIEDLEEFKQIYKEQEEEERRRARELAELKKEALRNKNELDKIKLEQAKRNYQRAEQELQKTEKEDKKQKKSFFSVGVITFVFCLGYSFHLLEDFVFVCSLEYRC